MPFFHRSVRDFSQFSFDLESSRVLIKKSMGDIFDTDIDTLIDCICAGTYYEKGNINTAIKHALSAVAHLSPDSSPEMRFCAGMILACSLHANGQGIDADKTIVKTKKMIEQHKAYYLTPNLQAYLTRQKLNNSDKIAAKEWLDHNIESSDTPYFYKLYRHLTSARAYIVIGNYTSAILLLQKLLTLCERYRRTLDIIETLLLLSIVYWKMGRGGTHVAMSYLERAVNIAYEYGYTQCFANDGAELINMLSKLQKRVVQKSYTGTLSSGFVKILHIAALAGAKRAKGLTGGRMPENLTFTEKQKAVMGYMCEGLNRNDIAAQMQLKPYTVKSHIALIYKKLDVSNSVDAILKIKELTLY
jgi:LuxR family maltose regulon positive regulatory protein